MKELSVDGEKEYVKKKDSSTYREFDQRRILCSCCTNISIRCTEITSRTKIVGGLKDLRPPSIHATFR